MKESTKQRKKLHIVDGLSAFQKNHWETLVVLLLMLALILAESIIFDFAGVSKNPVSLELPLSQAEENGCLLENGSYQVLGEDPQLILNNSLGEITRIQLNFAEPLSQELAIEVFFSEGNRFKANKSVYLLVPEGSLCADIICDNTCGEKLRLDLDGSFVLQSSEIQGIQYERRPLAGVLFCGICGLADLILAIFLFKKRKQATRKIGRGTRKLVSAMNWLLDTAGGFGLGLGKKLGINLCRFYVVAGLVLGITYSLLLPINGTPDEANHVYFMEESLGLEGLEHKFYEAVTEADIINHTTLEGNEVDREKYAKAKEIYFEKGDLQFTGSVSWQAIRYLPAAIGLLLGILFHLPVIWCFHLAEFVAVIYGVGLGYIALKIMPVKRELLCAIMLLPMSLQQCSSVNYDSVMLPVCYLFVAYMLYLKYREKKVSWGNIFLALMMLVVIASVKILYVLLGLLAFSIPFEHMDLQIGKWNISDFFNRKKYAVKILIALMILGALVVIRNMSYIQMVTAALLEWKQGMFVFKNTFLGNQIFYLTSLIGDFGWLDTPVSYEYAKFVIFSLLLLGQTYNEKLDGKRMAFGSRCNMAITTMLLVFLVVACMISWSFSLHGIDAVCLADYRQGLYGISVIEGVQGRYFLPMVFSAVVVWEGILKINKEKMLLWQLVHYVAVIYVPLKLLADRFWLM